MFWLLPPLLATIFCQKLSPNLGQIFPPNPYIFLYFNTQNLSYLSILFAYCKANFL